MRKTQKKLLGLLGLLAVVAMTVFAAYLPGPGASAVETTVTDTIKLRVVGTDPRVEVTGMPSGSVVTSFNQGFKVEYENVDTISVTVKYTDDKGNVYEAEDLFEDEDLNVNYCPGSLTLDNINLKTGEYTYSYQYYDEDGNVKTVTGVTGQLAHHGYGSYTVTVVGAGYEGEEAEPDATTFSYIPAYGEAYSTTNSDGTTTNYVNVHYTPATTDGGEVSSIQLVVKDASGEVFTIGPLPASSDGHSNIELPFADYNLPDGEYTIEIYTYGSDGKQLAEPYILHVMYEEDVIYVPSTADTGGFFQGLNISRTDYFITGLVAFGIITIAGAVFLIQNNRRKAMATRGVRVASRTSRSLSVKKTKRSRRNALRTKKTTKNNSRRCR